MIPAQTTNVIPVVEAVAKIPLTWGTAFGTSEMKILAILLVVDIILGVAAALAEKKFVFNMLANFMLNGVVPFLLGFAVVELVAQEFPLYGPIATFVVFVVIAVNIFASIIANLASLGLHMPPVLKRKA